MSSSPPPPSFLFIHWFCCYRCRCCWPSPCDFNTHLYLHCIGNPDTTILSVPMQVSRTSHGVVYWETVLWQRVVHSSTRLSIVASKSSMRGWYMHLTSGCHWGFFPVKLWATQLWNPPSVQTMWGVTTHVSEPKRRMAWTNALKILTGICVSAPFCPRISNIGLATTSSQLLSMSKVLAQADVGQGLALGTKFGLRSGPSQLRG